MLYFMFFGAKIQAINMKATETYRNPSVFSQLPDSLDVAVKKVRSMFSKETAELIEETTSDVDDEVSIALTKDPILRAVASKKRVQ